MPGLPGGSHVWPTWVDAHSVLLDLSKPHSGRSLCYCTSLLIVTVSACKRRHVLSLLSLCRLCRPQVSYKVAWTAISSLLTQLSAQYGPEVLLQLNVAYFLPSVPILMLQTLLNERLERRIGVPQVSFQEFLGVVPVHQPPEFIGHFEPS